MTMVSNVIFVAAHLLLGMSVIWSVIIQESGVISVKNGVTIISFVLVSFLNYWIWMCPMDRVRNVSISAYLKGLYVYLSDNQTFILDLPQLLYLYCFRSCYINS